MPRIPPATYRHAKRLGNVVSRLLPVCRDIETIRNETRWLRQHALRLSEKINPELSRSLYKSFVERRIQGEPLQYIIGSDFFGELEIYCRPGVLIPRQDTATWVTQLVKRMKHDTTIIPTTSPSLRLLDLCTGTGCIPLLFHHEYYTGSQSQHGLEAIGVDISQSALDLARENLIHQITAQSRSHETSPSRLQSLQSIGFIQADIGSCSSSTVPSLLTALASLSTSPSIATFDILTSNPPYISPQAFHTTTARSVRTYEPRLALVPPTAPTTPHSCQASDIQVGDFFYPRLLAIADAVQAKVLAVEVADLAQAQRVATMVVASGKWDDVEIWRDELDVASGVDGQNDKTVSCGDRAVRVMGSGHGRSVFAWRRT